LASTRELALLCRVRDRLCALPIRDVIETMRPLPIEPVGKLPAYVKGVAVVRGAPVPIVDLGVLLGDPAPASPVRFVTVRVGDRRVGLAVEAVLKVFALPAQPGALPPLLQAAGLDGVTALAAIDQQLLVLLSHARLVSEAEWAILESQQ
jgi:purine-binding chemotaxis protein CheW